MNSHRNLVRARNLLVGAGAYYLSRWLVVPLVFGLGKMTQGLIYRGEFNGKRPIQGWQHIRDFDGEGSEQHEVFRDRFQNFVPET